MNLIRAHQLIFDKAMEEAPNKKTKSFDKLQKN